MASTNRARPSSQTAAAAAAGGAGSASSGATTSSGSPSAAVAGLALVSLPAASTSFGGRAILSTDASDTYGGGGGAAALAGSSSSSAASSTKFIGVKRVVSTSKAPNPKSYYAMYCGKYIGTFATKEEGALAYDEALRVAVARVSLGKRRRRRRFYVFFSLFISYDITERAQTVEAGSLQLSQARRARRQRQYLEGRCDLLLLHEGAGAQQERIFRSEHQGQSLHLATESTWRHDHEQMLQQQGGRRCGVRRGTPRVRCER